MVEAATPALSNLAVNSNAVVGHESTTGPDERDRTSTFSSWASVVTLSGYATDGDTYNNRWRCELCGTAALPMTGLRHHCRTCRRTVCDGCSMVPPRGDRSCTDCSIKASKCEELHVPREKYVFLVRHAQSTWNQNVDLVKNISNGDFGQDMSLKDVVHRAARLPFMAKQVCHTDHPISEEGFQQTQELRCKIASMRQNATVSSSHTDQGEGHSSGSSSSSLLQRSEREKRYYDRFLMQRQRIYCSPLLRALQTAHLALPAEDSWGSIKLLKDARERFRFSFERDCIGAKGIVGTRIIDRAMRMGQNLAGLDSRVDASDCLEKWWSDEPETDAELEARLKTLWRRLLEEDGDDSCVLVTHSNLIKALLMHFGCVDEDGSEAGLDLNTDYLCGSHDSAQPPKEPARTVCKEARQGLAPSSKSSGKDALVDLDLGYPEQGREHGKCEIEADPWQVVAGSSESLRPLKTERLQNCGVLGLRCVLESPAQRLYPEVDGWIDLDNSNPHADEPLVPEPRWVARDALLMFDSVLVK